MVSKNFNTKKNILISSHRTTINMLINILHNQSRDIEDEINMSKVYLLKMENY